MKSMMSAGAILEAYIKRLTICSDLLSVMRYSLLASFKRRHRLDLNYRFRNHQSGHETRRAPHAPPQYVMLVLSSPCTVLFHGRCHYKRAHTHEIVEGGSRRFQSRFDIEHGLAHLGGQIDGLVIAQI